MVHKVKTVVSVIIIVIVSGYLDNLLVSPLGSKINPLSTTFSPSGRASHEIPSILPRAFLSGSGKLHLLFLHDVSFGGSKVTYYYHTSELKNGQWSVPERMEQIDYEYTPNNVLIEPSNNGFTIYHIDYCNFSKIQYEEKEERWLKPNLIFDYQILLNSQILDFLNIETEELAIYFQAFHIHGFYVLEQEEYLVVWSFHGSRTNRSAPTHEYDDLYIISRINSSGLIVHQPIYGEQAESPAYLLFMSHENRTMLYNKAGTKRTVLLSNGSWSHWQESVSEGLYKGLYTYNRKYLVKNRYFWGYSYWGLSIIDLTATTLRRMTYPIYKKPLWGIDIELIPGYEKEGIFIYGIITNNTIELWELDTLNESQSLVSSLSLDFEHKVPYDQGYFTDLIYVNGRWRFFWDQPTELSYSEIFTTSYDLNTHSWQPMTQVTNTTEITDDYFPHDWIPGFSYSVTAVGLIVTIVALRKARAKKESGYKKNTKI